MISRRGFFGALATAAVGVCVATKIPTAFLPQPIRYRAACEYLLKHYHAHTRGLLVNSKRWPRAIFVGRELFQSYEMELTATEYFSSDPVASSFDSLRFKSAILITHELAGLSGWDVMILSGDQWDSARARLEAGKSLEWVSNAA